MLIRFLLFTMIVALRTVWAGEPASQNPLRVMVSLKDGSRLMGEPALKTLTIQTSAMGKLEIPFAKVNEVKFSADHESATIALQNGDRVQGVIDLVSLKLTTLFGVVSVPLVSTTEIQVRPAGLGVTVEWERVPFPEDHNWPGAKGGPAIVDEDQIALQGHPVRTKQTFSLPLLFECEVEPKGDILDDTGLHIYLLPEAVSSAHHLPQLLDCVFGYGDGNFVVAWPGHAPQWLARKAFEVRRRRPYKLRIEVLPDTVRVTMDEQSWEAEGISLPAGRFRIELMGWQPTAQMVIRKWSIGEKNHE